MSLVRVHLCIKEERFQTTPCTKIMFSVASNVFFDVYAGMKSKRSTLSVIEKVTDRQWTWYYRDSLFLRITVKTAYEETMPSKKFNTNYKQ